VQALRKGLILQDNLSGMDKGFRMYEQAMWARVQQKGEEPATNLDFLFAKDAPGGFNKLVKSYGLPPAPE